MKSASALQLPGGNQVDGLPPAQHFNFQMDGHFGDFRPSLHPDGKRTLNNGFEGITGGLHSGGLHSGGLHSGGLHSGGLLSGGLLSRATDSGSGSALTCPLGVYTLGAYSLGAYSPEPRILDLDPYLPVLRRVMVEIVELGWFYRHFCKSAYRTQLIQRFLKRCAKNLTKPTVSSAF